MTVKYPSRTPRHVFCLLLCLLTVILVSACGGGAGSDHNTQTASLTFDVQWDRGDRAADAYEPLDVADCSDVATVSAAVFDADGALLQTGGPWSCTDGEATIEAVPANRDVQIAIAGHLANGLARYRGDSGAPFFLPAGAPFDAGLITAGSFLPVLTSPPDGATVLSTELAFAWSASSGAESYVVEIADNISFEAATILQTLDVSASSNPSVSPDTSALMEDIGYYWRVSAIDGAGNESEESGARVFSISAGGVDINRLPMPFIRQPADGTTIPFVDIAQSDGLGCSGNATDFEDGDIPGTDLAWSVTDLGDGRVLDSVEGSPITGEFITFEPGFFTPGNYRITLQATDSALATNTASCEIVIGNSPPVPLIRRPADGTTYLYVDIFGGEGLGCSGNATDLEDGNIPGSNLAWSVEDLGGGRVLDSVEGFPITGEFITFDPQFFSMPGNYRITLQATDSENAPGTVSHDIVIGNPPPLAQILSPANFATIYIQDISETGLDCSGSGTDWQDNQIPGSDMVWTATDINDGRVLSTFNGDPITGEFISFDPMFFTPSDYRITLRVTDAEGLTDMTSHEIVVMFFPEGE